MEWKDHSKLKGSHALLGASQNAWLRYTDEQLFDRYVSSYAQALGTSLHELAADLIAEKIKLSKQDIHVVLHHLAKSKIPRNVFDMNFIYPNLRSYVNDAIGYRMDAEKILYYSDNAYGTADSICFRNNFLRVHDYKSGKGPVKTDQLYIYVALFCLEYNIKPGEIEIETRLYHANEIVASNPTAEDILPIMDAIVMNDKFLSKVRVEGM